MATYINYDFDGKKIRIPKEEIEHNMKIPMVKTEEDAIWIWLEDNGYVDNEEQNELDRKAKENREAFQTVGKRRVVAHTLFHTLRLLFDQIHG